MIEKIKAILMNEDFDGMDEVVQIGMLDEREGIDFHKIVEDFVQEEEYGLREKFIIASTLYGSLKTTV